MKGLDMSLRLRILTTYSDLRIVWKGIRLKLSLCIPSGYMGSRGTDPLILILSSKGRWGSITLFWDRLKQITHWQTDKETDIQTKNLRLLYSVWHKYICFIVILLLATSFDLQRPLSGQYLQKKPKMLVYIVQKNHSFTNFTNVTIYYIYIYYILADFITHLVHSI